MFFKKKNKDKVCIDHCEEQFLNEITKKITGQRVRVSNGGGGFENVGIVGFDRVEDDEYFNEKMYYFETDDSWIGSIGYLKDQLLNLKYNK